jgi:hypothetical protein
VALAGHGGGGAGDSAAPCCGDRCDQAGTVGHSPAAVAASKRLVMRSTMVPMLAFGICIMVRR